MKNQSDAKEKRVLQTVFSYPLTIVVKSAEPIDGYMSAKITDTEMSWYPTESFPGKSAGASALSSMNPKIRR